MSAATASYEIDFGPLDSAAKLLSYGHGQIDEPEDSLVIDYRGFSDERTALGEAHKIMQPGVQAVFDSDGWPIAARWRSTGGAA